MQIQRLANFPILHCSAPQSCPVGGAVHFSLIVLLWAQNLPFQKILSPTLVCFCLSDWSHGSRPFTGFICLSVSHFGSMFFCFSYSYLRQIKLASSLVNFWAHNNIVYLIDWFIDSLIDSLVERGTYVMHVPAARVWNSATERRTGIVTSEVRVGVPVVRIF